MRATQVAEALRRREAREAELAEALAERRRVGQARHAEVDAALVALGARLAALEAALAEHVAESSHRGGRP